jgi:hypothetical protein
MRVINVIEVVENNVVGIESFGVFEEQLSQEVVDKAEELFLKKVEEFIGEPLSEEDKEAYLDNAYYEDGTKGYYYVCISWSDI